MRTLATFALALACCAPAAAGGQYSFTFVTKGEAASVTAYANQDQAIRFMNIVIPKASTKHYALENSAGGYSIRITVCGKTYTQNWGLRGSGVTAAIAGCAAPVYEAKP